ncbi:MAG: dTDP-4-dehydrorhamnose reductase [Methylophilaceae bacterium]
MKILLFGKNGQVGWELQRSLAPLGELVILDVDCQTACGDLANLEGIAKTIRTIAPDVIVNAAAYTKVDNAESENALVQTINTKAPGIMAQEAKLLGAWLVHYSTDYVFNGTGSQPWLETDATEPLSTYGRSKLDSEAAIIASGCKHLIFRTSWVYAARGANFAKTMLKLAEERESLRVISDQIGAPTGADLLADVTAHAIVTASKNANVSGLYHLVAGGEISWHGYAKFVIDYARQAGVDIKVSDNAIEAVPTTAFPTPAKRPLNSRLNTQKLQNTFNLQLPQWQIGVTRMLKEIL